MRDALVALLYVLIVATITVLYVDHENIELLKHPVGVANLPHEAESE